MYNRRTWCTFLYTNSKNMLNIQLYTQADKHKYNENSDNWKHCLHSGHGTQEKKGWKCVTLSIMFVLLANEFHLVSDVWIKTQSFIPQDTHKQGWCKKSPHPRQTSTSKHTPLRAAGFWGGHWWGGGVHAHKHTLPQDLWGSLSSLLGFPASLPRAWHLPAAGKEDRTWVKGLCVFLYGHIAAEECKVPLLPTFLQNQGWR